MTLNLEIHTVVLYSVQYMYEHLKLELFTAEFTLIRPVSRMLIISILRLEGI